MSLEKKATVADHLSEEMVSRLSGQPLLLEAILDNIAEGFVVADAQGGRCGPEVRPAPRDVPTG